MKPQDLLMRTLDGRSPSARDLELLVRNFAEEGTYHDYKSGMLLGKRREAADEIRWHVGGFANAEGGMLLVGFRQRDGGVEVDGVQTMIGDRDVTLWVFDALRPIAPFLSPEPRVYTVEVQGKAIVVVAVSPAPNLVPVRRHGELQYPRRFGDGTQPIPESLLADILIGRRRRAVVDVSESLLTVRRASLGDDRWSEVAYEVDISVALENRSLVSPCQVSVGFVSFSLQDGSSVAKSLTAYLVVDAPEPYLKFFSWHLRHSQLWAGGVARNHDLPPFCRLNLQASGVALLPRKSKVVLAGVYVLPVNALPQWYQFTWDVSSLGEGVVDVGEYDISRVMGRPRVGVALQGN